MNKKMRIGLLSDTHSHWDNKYEEHFANCDEIWHAGDIGSMELVEKFESFKPFRAVSGNIDDMKIRSAFPEVNRFTIEGVDVLLKHIGGYPGRYDSSIKRALYINPPKLFISGHSHILKVQYDPNLDLLHINPGAAGVSGFHQVRTLVRFVISKGNISDLEVIELGTR
ncbi:MAG: metallophosphoesterase family protein [Bacteroides sp.]|nr:metallophosphatase family protein [Bacteroides sp.]MDD2645941.1 metallophosphoesterase family protein [Bacteroides sp.]MDD4055105.1 metallophosphoesterase family protein [Bacteroides sp.]MDD4721019.1 metallophosphoesterase family protein [Bacteroides sp.]